MAKGRKRKAGDGDFSYTLAIDPSPFALAKTYDRLADELTDFTEAWHKIAPILGKGLGRNIDLKGSPIGEQWPAPNPQYESRKVAKGFADDLLKLTGAMHKEVRKGTIVSMGRTFLSVGLRGKKWEKAPALNFGSLTLGTPRRAFMGWSPSMKSANDRILKDHLAAGVAKAKANLRKA